MMSSRSEMKRNYPSIASKQKKKKDAMKNTSCISTYFTDPPSELPCTSQNNDKIYCEDVIENIESLYPTKSFPGRHLRNP